MIPKYCPQCGSQRIFQRYDFLNYEIYICQNSNCKLQFQVDSIDDMYLGPISGPCTYCGDPGHWKPDCHKLWIDLMEERDVRRLSGLQIDGGKKCTTQS